MGTTNLEHQQLETQRALKLSLAKLMYNNYCASVGGKAFNGDPLPEADEFFSDETKKKQSDAWLSAAASAVTFVESTPQIITAGYLRDCTDKWNGFKNEIDKFYTDENGEYSENNPVRHGDLETIGEVAASWAGWM